MVRIILTAYLLSTLMASKNHSASDVSMVLRATLQEMKGNVLVIPFFNMSTLPSGTANNV